MGRGGEMSDVDFKWVVYFFFVLCVSLLPNSQYSVNFQYLSFADDIKNFKNCL